MLEVARSLTVDGRAPASPVEEIERRSPIQSLIWTFDDRQKGEPKYQERQGQPCDEDERRPILAQGPSTQR